MISDPSLGGTVFVLQTTVYVKSAVITDLKPIEDLSCVKGKYSDRDGEELIHLDACYTTESEALEYAIENADYLLKDLRKRLDEVYTKEEESRVQNVAQVLAMLTEDDLSSIVDLQIEDVHQLLIQRRPDIPANEIGLLQDNDVTNFLSEHESQRPTT
jgi:hypothetical protein